MQTTRTPSFSTTFDFFLLCSKKAIEANNTMKAANNEIMSILFMVTAGKMPGPRLGQLESGVRV